VNNHAGYGPLVDAMDQTTGQFLLALPQGFEYRTIGEEGSMMDDGFITPGFHDGMMAFPGERGSIRLVRNHETRFQMGNPAGIPASGEVGPNPYDDVCNGGTTTIEIGRDGNDWGSVRSWRSASGTYFNCSGGNTSYGTWVTCEELPGGVDLGGDFFTNGEVNLTQKHGYVYEVDPRVAPGESPTPEPITAAGRFTHEGAVMDNATGDLYMTQDDFFSFSGLFRYLPPEGNKPHRDRRIHDGGRLQMLRVPAMPLVELFQHQEPGAHYSVDWVDIEDADPTYTQGTAWLDTLGTVSAQGFAQGAAKFTAKAARNQIVDAATFDADVGGDGR